VKKEFIVSILQLVSLVCLVVSLYFKNDIALIIATIITAICVVMSFYFSSKKKR